MKVKGYGAGAVLNGRYAGVRLFPMVAVTLALSADGSFDLVETPAPSENMPARHRQGRYRLYGNTLDLGGERHTVYPLDDSRPGRLVIDGRDFDPG